MTPSRSTRRVEGVLEAFRRTGSGRHAVVAQRHRLQPGLYTRTGRALWHRRGWSVPDHLERTRGTRAQRWKPDHGSWRVQLKVTALRILDVLLLRAVPLLWVRRSQGDERGHSLAVASRDGGCVLLDPERGRVTRTYSDGSVAEDQIELRRRWARHVASPAFEVAEGGRVLVEEYVKGRHLTELAPGEQTAAIRDVFNSYTSLVAAEGREPSGRFLAPLRGGSLWPALPDVLSLPLTDDEAIVPEPWPVVPTVTDTYSNNVVCRDGFGATFIDCFPLVQQPFFAVPVVCVARWTRQAPHLRDAYLSGAFDRELVDLCAAAGINLAPTLRRRRFLLAVGLLSVVVAGGDSRQDVPAPRLLERLRGRLSYYGLDDPRNWSPSAEAAGTPVDER